MKTTMKTIKFLSILVLILFCAYCGKDKPAGEKPASTPTAAAEEAPQKVTDNRSVLIIDQTPVSLQVFKSFMMDRYPDPETVQKNPRLSSRLLDMFIEHRLIVHMMEQDGIPVSQKEVEDFLRSKQLPQDKKEDRAVIENVKAQKYLYYKLYKDLNVSDTEIRDFYYQNKDKFRKKKQVFLHQILVKDRDQAYEIRRTLQKSPHEFETIAGEQSVSREARKGGKMGLFEKGTLPKDMEDVVFALAPNTISPVVSSAYGFHIFKITEIKEARLLHLNAVKEEIKKELMGNKIRWAYEDYLAQLRKQLKVEIKHDVLGFTYQPVEGVNNDNSQN